MQVTGRGCMTTQMEVDLCHTQSQNGAYVHKEKCVPCQCTHVYPNILDGAGVTHMHIPHLELL